MDDGVLRRTMGCRAELGVFGPTEGLAVDGGGKGRFRYIKDKFLLQLIFLF